ncbi:MAG: hypothetical protein C0425_01110 [Chlorobiaceae bacterium]|nr:hypothetical protein [Chlorobiaceae bacterium]MBA4308920.1 hypothetical protein [Chlorobiaceae bacterium]
MILNINSLKTDDGFVCSIPSFTDCEVWAHTEEEALEKIVSLAKYYLKIDESIKVKLDLTRGTFNHKNYKLIIDKLS